ncbi:MAG TPA: MJ0042-type zinc finger domain-containing protein [Gemmataceae bacterium]|nr:MJ0042-type zinc finger domain-containing protein [Gemmataceae bacterium]
MPIATTCPNCKALFRLPEEMAGRKVQCQKCASQFVVPKAEAETTVPGVPVAVEAEVVVEPPKPRGPASSIPLPPLPIDPPAVAQESDEDARYSDEARKPPPRKREERANRPRRDEKPKSSSATLGIILGILGFCALTCLICAGGTGVWMVVRNEEKRKPPLPVVIKDVAAKDGMPKDPFRDLAKDFAKDLGKEIPKKDGFGPPPPPPPPIPINPIPMKPNPAKPGVPIKAVLDKAGTFRDNNELTFADPRNPENRRHKLYSVRLEANKTYWIDMVSNRFDTYLNVVDDTNLIVAHDDDSGGGLNARVKFVPQRTADYHIEATCFGGHETGPYALSIQRQD